MASYAEIVCVEQDVAATEEEIITCTPERSVEDIKTIYLNENLELLHNLTLDLKEYYEHRGLLTFMETYQVMDILYQTMNVFEVQIEEGEDDDDEYETEIDEKNIFV